MRKDKLQQDQIDLIAVAYTFYVASAKDRYSVMSEKAFMENCKYNMEIFTELNKPEKKQKEESTSKAVAGFDEAKAMSVLGKGYAEAEELLKDPGKVERFLQRLENKLKVIPIAGTKLSYIPALASLVASYSKKEYADVPFGTIAGIVSALLYVVSPIDIIPDSIPGIGMIDDALVVDVCWKLVGHDVEEYQKWRDMNNKSI